MHYRLFHDDDDVPQLLGPCLFLFYTNDIADSLTSTVHLFADDTIIYLAVKGEQDSKTFQKDVHKLAAWGKTWMMEFHPNKCELISKPGSVTQHNILVC